MVVIVDLRAVRPGRLAATVSPDALAEPARALRPYLRGARQEALPGGIRLIVALDVAAIARLADEVRVLADTWPFFDFRLLADAPVCCLEVRGTGPAGDVARAVFAELAA